MTVLQLPPNESLRRRVSFESRYGTKFVRTRRLPCLPAFACASDSVASALMQLASASSDRLMLAPSTRRAPLLSVAEALSLPARSMRESLPMRTCSTMSAPFSLCSTMICITAWLLLLVSFFLVGSTVRFWLPLCSSSIVSSTLLAEYSVIPATAIPFSGSSRKSRYPVEGLSRSRMFSLYTSRYVRYTLNFLLSSLPIRSKSSPTVCTMHPGLSTLPSIVYVLPAPVAPYAKHEALKPSITPPRSFCVVASYTCLCVESCPKAWSNVYRRSLDRFALR
mmetsp:Transcript_38272/g.89363  ORF Transcript_38272/g.89363 Transcript_38272/m.89363 type:complete len:279 (-) Transcript_38272:397-1233(-)